MQVVPGVSMNFSVPEAPGFLRNGQSYLVLRNRGDPLTRDRIMASWA
jgi:hypothetical protein